MEVTVKYELRNIAPRFSKAIWRKYNVGMCYESVTEARKHYNLNNCCYEVFDKKGNLARTVNNAKMGCYGRRMP